jgi:hypothetical protein
VHTILDGHATSTGGYLVVHSDLVQLRIIAAAQTPAEGADGRIQARQAGCEASKRVSGEQIFSFKSRMRAANELGIALPRL